MVMRCWQTPSRWIGVHGSDHDDFGDVGDFVSFAFYIHADMSWYYRLSWKASISSLMIVGHNHILVVMMVLSHHWWWWWWLDRLVQGKPALSVLCPVQHHHHHHPRLRQLTNVEYYLLWLQCNERLYFLIWYLIGRALWSQPTPYQVLIKECLNIFTIIHFVRFMPNICESVTFCQSRIKAGFRQIWKSKHTIEGEKPKFTLNFYLSKT